MDYKRLYAIVSLHISSAPCRRRRLSYAVAVVSLRPLVVVGSRRLRSRRPIAHTKKRRRRCQLPSALIVVLVVVLALFAFLFSRV